MDKGRDGDGTPINERIEIAIRMNLFTREEFWIYVREVAKNQVHLPGVRPLQKHELRQMLRVISRPEKRGAPAR